MARLEAILLPNIPMLKSYGFLQESIVNVLDLLKMVTGCAACWPYPLYWCCKLPNYTYWRRIDTEIWCMCQLWRLWCSHTDTWLMLTDATPILVKDFKHLQQRKFRYFIAVHNVLMTYLDARGISDLKDTDKGKFNHWRKIELMQTDAACVKRQCRVKIPLPEKKDMIIQDGRPIILSFFRISSVYRFPFS